MTNEERALLLMAHDALYMLFDAYVTAECLDERTFDAATRSYDEEERAMWRAARKALAEMRLALGITGTGKR